MLWFYLDLFPKLITYGEAKIMSGIGKKTFYKLRKVYLRILDYHFNDVE